MHRRPRRRLAAAAAAALALCGQPVSAGGLRGRPQHEAVKHESLPEGRPLLSPEGAAEVASSEPTERALERGGTKTRTGRTPQSLTQLDIKSFEVPLLDKKFPYKLKHNTNNQVTSAVDSQLSAYLSVAFDGLEDLGLSCVKSERGSKIWVGCDGAAAFDEGEAPSANELRLAVRQAFQGGNYHRFLEDMYEGYELVREVDIMEARSSGLMQTRGRKPRGKKGKKKKKNGGKKGKKGGGKKGGKNGGGMKQMSGGGGGSKGKNIHNMGNGKNVLGFSSGKNHARPNYNLDGKGNIIVRGGG